MPLTTRTAQMRSVPLKCCTKITGNQVAIAIAALQWPVARIPLENGETFLEVIIINRTALIIHLYCEAALASDFVLKYH